MPDDIKRLPSQRLSSFRMKNSLDKCDFIVSICSLAEEPLLKVVRREVLFMTIMRVVKISANPSCAIPSCANPSCANPYTCANPK